MPWGLLMSDHTLLGPWIRRFLLEHIVAERNLARNTQHNYRDAFGLLIPFVAKVQKKPIDRLAIVDLSADLVRRFLTDLESERGCKIATACRHSCPRRFCGDIVLSTSNGAGRYARSRSRRPARPSFRTS